MRPYQSHEWATIVDIIRTEAPWRPFPQVLADADFMAAWLTAFASLEANRTLSKEALIAWWHSTQEYKDMHAKPVPVPDEPETPPPAARPDTTLPLRVSPSKRWFMTDLGLFNWREFTAMSLLSHWMQGRQAHVAAWMARAASKRVTILRCAGSLGGPYWSDTARALTGLDLTIPNTPETFTAARELTQEAARHGLKVRWFIFGDLHELLPDADAVSFEDWRDRRDVVDGHPHRQTALMRYAETFVRALTFENNVIWEVANEFKNIGFSRSEAFLWRVVDMIRREDPDAMVNLSGIDGADWHDPKFSRRPATYVSAHISRDTGVFWTEWIKRSGEAAVIDSKEMNRDHHQLEDMPFDSGEPCNFGDLRRDGRNGDVCQSEMAAFAAAAHSRARKHVMCFHHDDGLWCMGWGPDTDRCLDAFNAGLDAIPMSDDRVWRGHWAEAPFRADAFPTTDDVRAVEKFIQDGRGAFRAVGVGNRGVMFPIRADKDISSFVKGPGVEVLDERRDSNNMKAVAFRVR